MCIRSGTEAASCTRQRTADHYSREYPRTAADVETARYKSDFKKRKELDKDSGPDRGKTGQRRGKLRLVRAENVENQRGNQRTSRVLYHIAGKGMTVWNRNKRVFSIKTWIKGIRYHSFAITYK